MQMQVQLHLKYVRLLKNITAVALRTIQDFAQHLL